MSKEKNSYCEKTLNRLHTALDRSGLPRHGRGVVLSKCTGYSSGQLSGILSGKASLTERFVKAVCREYSINEKWILTGEGEMLLPTAAEPSPVYSVTKIIEGIRPDQAELLQEWERLTDEERKVILSTMGIMKGKNK